MAPRDRADFAFILTALYHLNDRGTAAILCYPGVLYRLKEEEQIRKWLVNNDYVDAVILLPYDLFPATSINTCIMILRKKRETDDILFIDASRSFIKKGKGNAIAEEHIEKIISTYRKRETIEEFSTRVPKKDILAKDCVLTVNSWVLTPEDDFPDINIDELEEEIDEGVAIQRDMAEEIKESIDELLKKKSEDTDTN